MASIYRFLAVVGLSRMSLALRVLLFAVLSASASAQSVADSPTSRSLTERQWAATFAGGVAGGGGLCVLLEPVMVGDVEPVYILTSVSVGTALGSYLAARAVGADEPFASTLAKATAGTLAGFGGAVVAFKAVPRLADAVLGDASCDLFCGRDVIGLAVGVGLVVVTPAAFAAHRSVEVAPAALAAPTGERGAGLRVRIGL